LLRESRAIRDECSIWNACPRGHRDVVPDRHEVANAAVLAEINVVAEAVVGAYDDACPDDKIISGLDIVTNDRVAFDDRVTTEAALSTD